jgi:hypothetical protein
MSSDDPIRASELLAMLEAVEGHRDSPLNAAHVHEVFEACLAHGEVSHPTCTVQGIAHTANFAMKELAARKNEIAGMLAQLPNEFMAHDDGGGGGWSFLNACNDRDGLQWTGFHLVMEQLVLLGLAIGRVQWCLPREMWSVLPGEMPYFVVVKPA